MIAEYKDDIYVANVKGDQVTLLTHDPNKKTDGFEPKREYFKKSVAFDDPDLTSIYDLHFWVKYNDSVEENELWLVDEGRYIGETQNIEEEKVVIDVNHDSKDETWKQFDKGAASKTIALSDCEEFIVEKKYIKRNGSKSDTEEKSKVNLAVFKRSMIANRRDSL